MARKPAFTLLMALSSSSKARRNALQLPVTRALCTDRFPIAGVDEVGVGALAGPIVAAAVMLQPHLNEFSVEGLDDSKRLSRKRREKLYLNLLNDKRVEHAVAIVSAKQVDEMNVLNARLKAMSLAIKNLRTEPGIVFVDGHRALPDIEADHQRVVVGGDASISVIAAASIIAKVTRDKIMSDETLRFPLYGFDKHVGYGTKAHLEAIALYGPCSIHRKSFKPMRLTTSSLSKSRIHLSLASKSTRRVLSKSMTSGPNTLICTSLTASTLSEQLTQSRVAADAGADLVEIRVDLLKPDEQLEWHRLLPALNLPAIVTNRPVWEGGASEMPEEQRLGILLDAVQRGASHIDVELKAAPVFKELCQANNIIFPLERTELILSHHDFEKPLPTGHVDDIIDRMRRAGASICKIAMMATSALDNFVVFRALARSEGDCIILAMGDLGQVSRIAAAKYGAYLTFASVAKGDESAPGQVDVATLIDMYRFQSITRETPLFGVIGDPVSHSMSPAVHNAAMRLKEINGLYVPLRVESEYARFVREVMTYDFAGLSVTIPGKVPVIEAMDEMDDVAKQIGAMNTVVKQKDGRLKGYNTDWVAAISAVEEQFVDGLTGRRVVCIGAGGAGRALAFGALARGASHVFVVNRSEERAEQLANDLGDRATSMSLEAFNKDEKGSFDVLMNSTSVGMHPNEEHSPVAVERLQKGVVVFDAVYNPLQTRLLREAEERGCIPVSGVEMFVRQAAEQFRLWFPHLEPPVSIMREVVFARLEGK